MGVGPVALALYRQLAKDTILARGHYICEIGSQDVVARGHENLIAGVFAALGVDTPTRPVLTSMAAGSSRELMTALGFKYSCIDTDGRHGSIVLDLNFDGVPSDKRSLFDVVANHGTTEHVFDQANSFRVIHELTKVGGIMVHCVPFRGYANHCFFAYHPELFEALARANGYQLLGMWVTFGDSQAHLIPWDDNLFANIFIPQNTNVLLSVVLRRMFEHDFQVPFQTVYEAWNTDANAARYTYVVDGGLVDGLTVKRIVLSSLAPASPGPPPGRTLKGLIRRSARKIRDMMR
jgi:hypothetical protein